MCILGEGEEEGGREGMKLYVTMLNLMPLEMECPPTRRVVEIELTPEQAKRLKPRFVGKSREGIEQFETVESCVLGEDEDDWGVEE